jgi:hypothetical protein
MYRAGAVSLRSKLSRLSLGSPVAPLPVAPAPVEAAALALPAPAVEDRTAKLDELRARIHAVLERTVRPASPPPVDTVELPFVTEATPLGPLSRRTQRLSAAHRIGRAPLLPSRGASAELLALLALDPALATRDPAGALYLDTETTGLNGGTGTVAFLVGLAYWDEGAGGLTIEQILVRNLGEEAPMLAHVAERIRRASMLVTFNGKSFDLPLLRTRFVMARIAAPEEPPHLDLVHVARRLHKPRVECKLTTLERRILGFERHDDVPSGEVSQVYLHFLRTGDARALLGVIEHNLWDVLTMAALVGLYGEPLDGTRLAAEDLVGVARTFRRAGEIDRAYDVASQAVDSGGGHESVRARAEIAKARGDRARALADFEALSEAIDDARVRLELAKLYEHYVREPSRALALVEQGTAEGEEGSKRRARRLAAKVERSRQAALPGLAVPGVRAKR